MDPDGKASWQRGSSSQCRFLLRVGSTWTDLWTPAMQGRPTATGRRSSRILKDTHTGAFAVIFGGLYLILYAAACTELDEEKCASHSDRVYSFQGAQRSFHRNISGGAKTWDAGRFYEGCEKEDRGSLHARDLFPRRHFWNCSLAVSAAVLL